MGLERQIYKRSETFERLKVKFPATGKEFIFAEKRLIEGERFTCTISRSDASGNEQLFKCELFGKVEIEQQASGEFRLSSTAVESIEKKAIGELKWTSRFG